MDRKSNKLVLLVPWQSLLISLGGGALVALIDILVLSVGVLYLEMLIGIFSAASVFKYGSFKKESGFIPVFVVVALCVTSSIWTGIFRHGLCSLLCVMRNMRICNYCSVAFMQRLIIIGGVISTLMGVLFSLTLGKQSLK